MIKWCLCRTCAKKYDEAKSRADWKGYCSMKCQNDKLRQLGYKPNEKQTYNVLKRANEIGSVYVTKEGPKK